MATNTRKKLCSELRLGDSLRLPAEVVKLTGEGTLPYCIVSDDSKGKMIAYEIEYQSGPLKGSKGMVVVLSEAKVDYVLQDPLGKRLMGWVKGKFKKKAKKPLPKRSIEVEINRLTDWVGF